MEHGSDEEFHGPQFEQAFLTSEIKIESEEFIAEEEPLPDDWPSSGHLSYNTTQETEILPTLTVPQEPFINYSSILQKHAYTSMTAQPSQINTRGFTVNTNVQNQSIPVKSMVGTNNRSYLCTICNKRFSSLSALENHKELDCNNVNRTLIHCNFCNERFLFKENLDNHLRLVHKISYPKKHACTTCGELFTTNRSLKSHKILHKMVINKQEPQHNFLQTPVKVPDIIIVRPDILMAKSVNNYSTSTNNIHSTSGPNILTQLPVKKKQSQSGNFTNSLAQPKPVSKFNVVQYTPQPICILNEEENVDNSLPNSSNHSKLNDHSSIEIDTEINSTESTETKDYKKCYICSKLFYDETSLKMHIDNTHKLKHKCYCGENYRTKFELDFHKTQVHPKKDKASRLKERRERCKTERESVTCGICHKIFYIPVLVRTRTLKDIIEQHIVTRHLNKIELYKCSICNEKFLTCSSLKNHLNVHDRDGLLYRCVICDKSIVSKELLSNHLQVYHDSPDIIREEDIAKLYIPPGSESEEEREDPYAIYGTSNICQFCGKKFMHCSSARIHTIIKHLKIVRYYCDYCDHGEYKKSELTEHIVKNHLRTKRYACIKCEYKCYHRYSLRDHVKRVHRKIKSYACKYCNKSYSYNSSMKNHVFKVHNSEEYSGDYRCIECNFAYNNLEKLNHHNMNYHTKYDCDICKVSYYGKTRLRKHISKFHNCKPKKFKSGTKPVKKCKK